MRRLPIVLLATLATMASAADPASKTATLKGASGTDIGQVTLTDAPKGVLLRVTVHGLTPGWHGIHFHEKADCSGAMFKTAGGHVHMMSPAVHGLLNPEGNDLGDLPNLYVGPDGTGIAELFSPFVALHAGSPRADLLDADGSAVVIHAKPDDYASQPIGGAGDRVACAELHAAP